MTIDNKTYTNTQARFNDEAIASDYVKKKNLTDNAKNRREIACIESALGELPAGAKVLDLPCGTGRLAPMLLRRGFHVTAADYSRPMLDQAEKFMWDYYSNNESINLHNIRFSKQDIQKTSFTDEEFDAVICNRLFHHYPHAETRRRVLAELGRITKGHIVLSYFSNASLSALKFHVRNLLNNRTADDRIPIWESVFMQDLESCNLRIVSRHPVRYGVSPQTYLRLEKTPSVR